jgi:predicted transcriptional regulator
MGRPKAEDVKERQEEKRKQWNQKIKAKTHKRLKPQIEMMEQKIIQPFFSQQKTLGYEQLLRLSCLSRRTFDKYLKGLVKKGTIAKVRGEGKREIYWLKVVPNKLVFQVLITSFLHQSLTNDSINLFNKRLGSLIVYTLRHHDTEAVAILAPIISQLGAYINLPKTFMGEPVSLLEPKVEKSIDWKTWRDFDKTASKPLSRDKLFELIR